jgi:hypothetical protein
MKQHGSEPVSTIHHSYSQPTCAINAAVGAVALLCMSFVVLPQPNRLLGPLSRFALCLIICCVHRAAVWSRSAVLHVTLTRIMAATVGRLHKRWCVRVHGSNRGHGRYYAAIVKPLNRPEGC